MQEFNYYLEHKHIWVIYAFEIPCYYTLNDCVNHYSYRRQKQFMWLISVIICYAAWASDISSYVIIIALLINVHPIRSHLHLVLAHAFLPTRTPTHIQTHTRTHTYTHTHTPTYTHVQTFPWPLPPSYDLWDCLIPPLLRYLHQIVMFWVIWTH